MKLQIVLVALLALTLTSCDYDSVDAASAIIDSQSEICKSSSRPWSQRALQNMSSLENLYKTLRDDPSCSGLAPTLESLSAVSAQVHGLIRDSSFTEYRQNEENLQDLTLAIKSAGESGNTNLVDLLTQELALVQSDLSRSRASNAVYSDKKNKIGYNDVYSQNTQELASNFSSMISSSSGLSECLKKHPSAYIQLFGNIAAVGGSFISPIVGAGIQTVAGFAGATTEILQDRPLDYLVSQVQEQRMSYAMTCGMEGLTNFYCQADEAYQLLELQKDLDGHPTPPADLWKGMDLLSHSMPMLNNWLLSIKKGVPPQNGSDADRFNNAIEKNMALDTTTNSVLGALIDTKSKINSTTDPNTKKEFLIQIIIRLSQGLSGDMGGGNHLINSNNPFTALTDNALTYACYFLLGYPAVCPPFTTAPPIKDYIEKDLLTTNQTIDDVINIFWPQILNIVKNKVEVEFAETILINPELILTDATENRGNFDSPRTALIKIRTFITNLRTTSGTHPERQKFIDFNLKIICVALNAIDHTSVDCGPAEPPSQFPSTANSNPLVDLFNVFKLKNSQYFSINVSRLVDMDLQDRLERGEFPSNVEEVIRGSTTEIRHRLKAATDVDPVDLYRDLNSALPLAEANMNIFSNAFPKSLWLSLYNLKNKSLNEPTSGFNRPNSQNLATLCLQTLASTDDWPNYLDWYKFCEGAKLFPFNDDPTQPALELTAFKNYLDKLKAQDRTKWKRARICAYHKFMRADRIRGMLKGRQQRPPPPPVPWDLSTYFSLIR